MTVTRSTQECDLSAVGAVRALLAGPGLHLVAQVKERDNTFDLALEGANNRRIVVRCTILAQSTDYRDLATMLAEGDFDRAVLVYCEKEGSVLSDEIETWFVGDVERLAASLAREAP